MSDARTIFDPFLGKDVVIVDRLTDRLRGNYACGPHLPNGRPEFGFRQFQAPPIQHEAAAVLDALMRTLEKIACRHVTEAPLWWQQEARDALSAVGRNEDRDKKGDENGR